MAAASSPPIVLAALHPSHTLRHILLLLLLLVPALGPHSLTGVGPRAAPALQEAVQAQDDQGAQDIHGPAGGAQVLKAAGDLLLAHLDPAGRAPSSWTGSSRCRHSCPSWLTCGPASPPHTWQVGTPEAALLPSWPVPLRTMLEHLVSTPALLHLCCLLLLHRVQNAASSLLPQTSGLRLFGGASAEFRLHRDWLSSHHTHPSILLSSLTSSRLEPGRSAFHLHH